MTVFPRALRPLVPLLLASLLILAVIDWGLFRSGLYAHWIKPGSTTGALVGTMRAIDGNYDPERRNVLVLGNSRVAEGFSGKLADVAAGRGDLHFINGATPGTSLRVWHYMLREIDPVASRFDAIVMMVSYDLSGTRQMLSDNPLDGRYLATILRFSDYWEFPATFHDEGEREHARRSVLFPPTLLREDIFDFASDPRARLREVHRRDEAWADAVDNYRGKSRSVPELAIDHATGRPSDWGADARKNKALLGGYFKQMATPADEAIQQANIEYQRAWLRRITNRYAASGIPVIVFAIPRGPFHAELGIRLKIPATVSGMAAEGQLTALPGEDFSVLERPQYFFDAQHMNREGRNAFSAMLAKRVAPLLR